MRIFWHNLVYITTWFRHFHAQTARAWKLPNVRINLPFRRSNCYGHPLKFLIGFQTMAQVICPQDAIYTSILMTQPELFPCPYFNSMEHTIFFMATSTCRTIITATTTIFFLARWTRVWCGPKLKGFSGATVTLITASIIGLY